VDASIADVVVVSHWDWIGGVEKEGERSCCERWINGVGWVRKNSPLQYYVA